MGKKFKKAYKKALKSGFDPAEWNRQHESSGNGWGWGSQQNGNGKGMLQGLLGNLDRNQQFIVGALVGAVASYILTDEEIRTKIMKSAVKMYTGVVGGFEEAKEKMADIKAEMDAQPSAR